MPQEEHAISVRSLAKAYGQVEVLKEISIDVDRGRVLALLGDNGAGKSTLIKCLSGVHRPDRGQIFVGGEEVTLKSPTHARSFGIETVYQDLALAPDLDCSANFHLGRELRMPGIRGRCGFIDARRMAKSTVGALDRLGIAIPSARTPVSRLSGGQRQAVAIARAAHWAKNVILLDEPTAALGVEPSSKVLDVIRRVRDEGLAVVLISHNLPQVFEVADRIVVLFGGFVNLAKATADTSIQEVVAAMVGARADDVVVS